MYLVGKMHTTNTFKNKNIIKNNIVINLSNLGSKIMKFIAKIVVGMLRIDQPVLVEEQRPMDWKAGHF